jgi:hypothetical protein
MSQKTGRWKKVRLSLRKGYWKVVRRFNREAFLRHVVECDTRGDFREEEEDLLCIDTYKWKRRADRVHISPDEIPLQEGCEGHWVTAYDGDQFLRPVTLRRLQRMVEDHCCPRHAAKLSAVMRA